MKGPSITDRGGLPTALALVAAGGALGALARHGLAVLWPHRPGGVPWATLAVNVSGCLLIGALMVLLTEVPPGHHRLLRPLLGPGLLGGYTTFSTYVVETQGLLADGAVGTGAGYLAGTLGAALAAVHLGAAGARRAARRRAR